MKAKNVTCGETTSPWRSLAAAVVLRAVEDAQGKGMLVHRTQRAKVSREAARWLQAGAGEMLDALDIDEDALLGALKL